MVSGTACAGSRTIVRSSAGVRVTAAGSIYRLGLALLDKNEPWKVLKRSEEWILGPKENYERIGDVGDVVRDVLPGCLDVECCGSPTMQRIRTATPRGPGRCGRQEGDWTQAARPAARS
ncbi:MAG: hypothetical protein LAN62_02775 [Acidobacteriia bacterium]|nr:hypothetical protein [Terriglobia bacterium]